MSGGSPFCSACQLDDSSDTVAKIDRAVDGVEELGSRRVVKWSDSARNAA